MNKRFIFLIAFVSIMIGFAFAPERAIGAGRRPWIDDFRFPIEKRVAVSKFLVLTFLLAFVKKESLPLCEARRSSRSQIKIN
ncbi:MAG: hypothetical protein IIC00_14690 [Planctomycetes bacterium]|nr:hypothetical protein [Planctomycetota bacterium]